MSQIATRIDERVPTPESFTSDVHSPAVTARVGSWLGIAFTICFVTGLVSHWAYAPNPWIPFPTAPSWGYRLNQGLHIASGFVSVPLLLVKLGVVYPKLFRRPPPLRRVKALALEVAERLSIAVLVAAAVFQVAIGVLNQAQQYVFPFPFRSVHYAMSWVLIGALVVHIAVKLPTISAALGSRLESRDLDPDHLESGSGLSRRGLLTVTGIAGLGALLTTVGQSLPGFRQVSVLATRSGTGPQGVPINVTADQARVIDAAQDPSYALEIVVGDRTETFTRQQLLDMPQVTETLPIACVEGWSADGTWTGPRVAALLDAVDAPRDADLRIISLQERGAFSQTVMPANFARHPSTLLALKLYGDDLVLDHGYPARVIAPNRPGVMQTKWVTRIEVMT
ncbi:molybdopterin-dependent oxidoreductase [Nocardioidaceae bacterium]|nr:molybdopterin-dependent oxidoreductase [Nocardioidaceae bacterium]